MVMGSTWIYFRIIYYFSLLAVVGSFVCNYSPTPFNLCGHGKKRFWKSNEFN